MKSRKSVWMAAILLGAFFFSTGARAQQFGHPASTVAAGVWTPVNAATHHAATNLLDDTTYIDSGNGNATTAEVALDALTDPASSVGHIIRFRAMSTGGGGAPERIQVDLYEGATLIASSGNNSANRGAFAEYTYTLLAPETDAITDYSNLRFQVISSNLGGGESVQVSLLEFEVPNAVASSPPTVDTPTFTAITDTTATLGATIQSDGGAAVTDHGTVWDTTATPAANASGLGAHAGPFPAAFTDPRTGLPAGTQIFFRGYAANTNGTAYSADASFYTEPAAQPTGLVFSLETETTMRISWTAPGAATPAEGAIVVMRAASAVTNTPADGTEHAANAAFGSGADLGGGEFVVFRATGTQVDVTGLTASTTYFVSVFEYAGTGAGASGVNYRQAGPLTGSWATTAPAGLPTLSAPTVANVDPSSADLGATIDGDGGSALTDCGTVWSDANPTPTIADNPASKGGPPCAVGAFTHNRTALPAGTLIYFRGYATNGNGTGYSAVDQFYTEPDTQASAVVISNETAASLQIDWTAGTGDGAIVVIRAAAAVTQTPTDGTEHAANTGFAAGEDLGGNEYVIFRAAGTSVTVTGLTASTTYFVAVYEYAGTGAGSGGINYVQTGAATGNGTTLAGVAPTGHNYNPAIVGLVPETPSLNCDRCHAMHASPLMPVGTEQLTVCQNCHNPLGLAPAFDNIALHNSDAVDCGACHNVHKPSAGNPTESTDHLGTTGENLSYIRANTTKYVPAALEPAVFQLRPSHFAFQSTDPPYNAICQTCHTDGAVTPHHMNTSTDDHNFGADCTTCHAHVDSFSPTGGGTCDSCHSTVKNAGGPQERRIIWGASGDFVKTAHHVTDGTAGEIVTAADCGVCHQEPGANHMDKKVDLKNPDTGAAFSIVDLQEDPTEAATIQNNLCIVCHDTDGATNTEISGNPRQPFNTNTRNAPDVAGDLATTNDFYHPVLGRRGNAFCDASTLTQFQNPGDLITCFDCHDQNAHGSTGQRMVLTSNMTVGIDFDGMQGGVYSGAAADVHDLCLTCHASGVYIGGAKSTSNFNYAGNDHDVNAHVGGNGVGCFVCHAGSFDGAPTVTNGGRPGLIHGGTFTWTDSDVDCGGGTPANGSNAEMFLLGGALDGWVRVGAADGCCGGAACNHAGGRNY